MGNKKNTESKLLKLKKININNILFLLIYIFLSTFILTKLFSNNNTINYTENRKSYQFKMPKIEEILDNTFQTNFENAVIDQMPKTEETKNIYNNLSNNVLFGTLKAMDLDKVNKYITLNKDVMFYKNYLVYNFQDESTFKIKASDDIENINAIYSNINANMYLYFVETDSNNKFDTNNSYDIMNYLQEQLLIPKENISVYDIKNFENDYKNAFYKTDHHWNHNGSYNGYRDIAKLMYFDSIYEKNNEICFNNSEYRGSKSLLLGSNNFLYDNICIYNFDFPEFKIKANNVELKNYGSNIIEIEKNSNISYGSVYGGDYAELVFENQEIKNGRSLLIYSNSYSNAINKLLASNYETTYVIDGRYYKDYDMITYIKKHEIDDVLILANSMLFWDNVAW